MTRRLLVPCLIAVATTASAQRPDWRTLEVSRQLRDTSRHAVKIQYGAGRLDVRPTTDPLLFSMQLKYDDANSRPVHRYNATMREVTLGIGDQHMRVSRNMKEHTRGELDVALSSAVPMSLDMEVGAAKADVELGGLRLEDLKVSTGAAETNLRFSRPNPAKLRHMEVNVGAAGLTATGLANANARSLKVNGGVGSIDLSFDGSWSDDMDAEVDVALGKLTLRVPDDVGVRITVQRFLSGFDHPGYTKRGGSYYSSNWDGAARKLTISAQAALGGIEVTNRRRSR